MKKRNLMIAVVLFVILAVCYLIIRTVNDRNEEAQEEQEAMEVQLLSLSADTIQGFSFLHEGTEYAFERNGDGDWIYPADENFPVDNDTVSSLLMDLEDVDYSRRLENVEDLSDYGLDEPSNVITVTDAQGTKYTITIGNMNGSTGDYYIYLDEDTDVVYTISSTIPLDFELELYDLVDAETFPSISADEIARIRIETAAEEENAENMENAESTENVQTQPYVLEIAAADAEESSESSEEETSAWEIVQDDAVQTADSDGVTSLLDHFGSMYYSSCVEYYATDLAAYGLEEAGGAGLYDPHMDDQRIR